MKALANSTGAIKPSDSSEIPWQDLYDLLRPLVKRWVYASHVDSWKGQEDDIVEDIVQEAIIRTLKYARRADSGEVAPIDFLERLSIVIAHNYCRDLKRRDQRLLHVDIYDRSYGEDVDRYQQDDPSEIAFD